MMPWMEECRRQPSDVMGGWMDVSPSLFIGARSANLAIALVRYLGQFDLNQVETSGAAPMLGAKDWQGGSSSIIEAISIRASGSWCTSSAIPTLISHFAAEQVAPLKAFELPPPDR
ncbi:hypothetical protein ACCS60_11800 [Rhizobium acaciae]|uniref:hypothetical protein n=1 Tax=Rhizobium acaciae TaxID=2989736 RepID=UPI003F94713C